MKILLISSSSGSHGGGEFYLHGLAEGLLGRGHEVHVAMSTHEKMNDLANGFCEGVKIRRIGFQNTYDFRTRVIGCHFSKQADRNLPPLLDQLQPDVVHLNKQNLEDGLDLLRTIKNCDVPSVATIHVTRSAQSLGAFMGSLRDHYARRQLSRFPGSLIAVAGQCCEDLRAFLGDDSANAPSRPQAFSPRRCEGSQAVDSSEPSPRFARPSQGEGEEGDLVSRKLSRCLVVHNGVPGSDSPSMEHHSLSPDQRLRWLGEAASLREPLETQSDCQLILGAIARIEEQKNPLMAVKVLKQLPDSIHWVWVGDGRMRLQLEDAAAEAGVSSRLHLLGWQADARRFMPAFDVFALPSLYEGFPLAILEAMAEQLPCVVSDVDGCREAVIEGQTGFLCRHDDVQQWCDRILLLHDDVSRRDRMSATGLNRWKEHFSLDAMAEATEKVYLQEIERHRLRNTNPHS